MITMQIGFPRKITSAQVTADVQRSTRAVFPSVLNGEAVLVHTLWR